MDLEWKLAPESWEEREPDPEFCDHPWGTSGSCDGKGMRHHAQKSRRQKLDLRWLGWVGEAGWYIRGDRELTGLSCSMHKVPRGCLLLGQYFN